MNEARERLVKDALARLESRYMVVSVVAKRANQLARHPESQGAGWAINQALKELLDDKIKYEVPAEEKVPKKGRASRSGK
ncbi:MAG: DNA-directed RNA polymerase subunit omega [Acidobacteria bacterium]|nr:DNA-directed RNA polymerase subunit omega [Acidobacteriota bacterium]